MASTPVSIADLTVDAQLHTFLTSEVLPAVGVSAEQFFAGLSEAVHTLGPRNRELLAVRDRLQAAIDEWHRQRKGLGDPAEYRAFLAELGYLVPAGSDFTISTANTDPEIATINGPQLVVPVTNARYALNAVNARWASLYDSLYGTDALGDSPPQHAAYDPERGARVISWARTHLDAVFPLTRGTHADIQRYYVQGGTLATDLGGLASPDAF